jgi:hypothetical protein
MRKKLVKRSKRGIQNVSYVLTEGLDAFEKSENMKRWIDHTIGWKEVKGKEQDFEMLKRQYGKFTEEYLDRTIERDLSYFLLNVLFELDTLVSYSLEARNEKNEDFWKFVGNPLYRLFQRSFVDNCRASPEYRKRFYEKLDSMITKFKGEYEHGKI